MAPAWISPLEADAAGPPCQRPVGGWSDALDELMDLARHPAVRLGVLDAQAGRPLDHDHIGEHILAETPAGSLRRLRWPLRPLTADEVAVAQYRYEEGRLLVLQAGLRCRAWGHPDFPPAAIRRYVAALSLERQRAGHPGGAP